MYITLGMFFHYNVNAGYSSFVSLIPWGYI